MKLLFVGKTNFQYNRDLILLNGLAKRMDTYVKKFQITKRDWSTFKSIREQSKKVDFVVIPSFRHKDVLFVKLASKAPVVFDPLISKYMTKVLDYNVWWKAPHKYIVDWLAFYWPDVLIWDTQAHLEYIRTKYKLKKPMSTVYIGADTSLFYPMDALRSEITTVGFYGSFNPLQGIDKIIKAAHLLKEHTDIQFKIIGKGSTYADVRQLAEKLDTFNVEFVEHVPYTELNTMINTFDICLGVFGESLKTDVVIPNKIFHYAAAGKCIITKDTKAIREVFVHEENIYVINNTPEDLASSIVRCVEDKKKCSEVGANAFSLVSTDYNEDKVAESFIQFLKTQS